MGVSLVLQVTSDGTRRNSLKLCQGKFRMVIRQSFFTERVVKYWNRLCRDMVVSPSLETFTTHVNGALRTGFCGGLGSAALMVGFNDLRNLVQPK